MLYMSLAYSTKYLNIIRKIVY